MNAGIAESGVSLRPGDEARTASNILPPSGPNDISPTTTNRNESAQASLSNPGLQAANPGSTGIPRDVTPIVQQQLDALATQQFVWQGQAWPGQAMWWEITGNPEDARRGADDPALQWQTRLKLQLPLLGGLDAVLRLNPGGEIAISITTDSPAGEQQLREAAASLHKQYEAAGLHLTQLQVQHAEPTE